MWKKLPLKESVIASLAINILVALSVLGARSMLPPVVPLFYGLPAGQDQLVPTLGLLIVPTGGLIVTLLNIFLSTLFKDQFFKRALIASSTLISVLAAIAVIKIMFLVGYF